MSFFSLSFDVRILIFKELCPVDDYPNLVLVCKAFRRTADSPTLWAYWLRETDEFHPIGENASRREQREALFWLQLERQRRVDVPRTIRPCEKRAAWCIRDVLQDFTTSRDFTADAWTLVVAAAERFLLKHFSGSGEPLSKRPKNEEEEPCWEEAEDAEFNSDDECYSEGDDSDSVEVEWDAPDPRSDWDWGGPMHDAVSSWYEGKYWGGGMERSVAVDCARYSEQEMIQRDSSGRTPLILFLQLMGDVSDGGGHMDDQKVEWAREAIDLLWSGVDCITYSGQTAAHIVAGWAWIANATEQYVEPGEQHWKNWGRVGLDMLRRIFQERPQFRLQVDSFGRTPLHICPVLCTLSDMLPLSIPPHLAVELMHQSIAKEQSATALQMLSSRSPGLSPSTHDPDSSLLLSAAEHRAHDSIFWLCQNGWNPNAVDDEGYSALELYLEAGEDIGMDDEESVIRLLQPL